ncbi:MAG: SMEK domain-containing protein [Rickettsiales bacterium]|nr:SMEK domain-containing protein [Rickettsiales bacterium]
MQLLITIEDRSFIDRVAKHCSFNIEGILGVIITDEDIYKQIVKDLNILFAYIQDLKEYQDAKIYLENIAKDLLNIMHDLSLKNLNTKNNNHHAVDLGDEENDICYQVTWRTDNTKINDTIETYDKYEIEKKFSKLKILMLGLTNKASQDEMVVYRKDFFNDIKNLSIEKKNQIRTCLEKHLNLKPHNCKLQRMSLEVATINQIIEVISKPQDFRQLNLIKKPYPAKKLELRFNDYQEVIKEKLGQLEPHYQIPMYEAMEQLNSGVKRNLEIYWRTTSFEILHDSGDDARKALDVLITKIKKQLVGEFSECAVEFFVLHELANCNVFPLKTEEKALIETE